MKLGRLWLANMAVLTFFMISGYVLTRSWDGDFLRFLLRRFVRYVAGLRRLSWNPLMGSPAASAWPGFFGARSSMETIRQSKAFMVLDRGGVGNGVHTYNCVGRAGMPAMRFAWVVALSAIAVRIYSGFAFGVLFIFGALVYRLEFRNKALEAKFPQWLGKKKASTVHIRRIGSS